MSNLENSKVSELKNGILTTMHFLARLSDLNFSMNIRSRNFFKENLRDFKHVFEQIRTNIKGSIDFSNFQQFNQFQLFNHLVSGKTLTPHKIKGNRTIGKFLNTLSLFISAENYALKSKFPMNTAHVCNKLVANNELCATLSGDTNVVSYEWRIVSEFQTHLTNIIAHVCDIVTSCFLSLGESTHFRRVDMTKVAYTYSTSLAIIGNQYSGNSPLRPSFMTTTKEVNKCLT